MSLCKEIAGADSGFDFYTQGAPDRFIFNITGNPSFILTDRIPYILKKRLLIAGGSGFLGLHVFLQAGKIYGPDSLFMSFNKSTFSLPGAVWVHCDFSDSANIKKLIDKNRPDTVIYCAAVSSPEECEVNPLLSSQVNTITPSEAACYCAKKNMKFIYTSSDLVFDGLNAPYKEEDPVSPVNRYGKQKALSEQMILSANPDALICRLPLMYGYSISAKSTFTTSVLDSLKKRRPVYLFYDEFRTPAPVSSVAKFLVEKTEPLRGILHLGGKERISRYQFGLIVAKAFGFDSTLITAVSQSEIECKAPRPPDVSLESTRAFAEGYSPGTVSSEITLWKSMSVFKQKKRE